MNPQSYCERILHFINHELQVKPHLISMQDNAPCHNVKNAQIKLKKIKDLFHTLTNLLIRFESN